MGPTIDHRLLQYEFIEMLGGGSMGVVYKAPDTHLYRFVAIKVLPPQKVPQTARKGCSVEEAVSAVMEPRWSGV
jgi:serine/threonine protein kinase